MAPSDIKRALTRRLAYLEVTIEDEKCTSDASRCFDLKERDALRSALERLGLFDQERLDNRKAAVREHFQHLREGNDASSAA